MNQIDDHVWTLDSPLSILGVQIGRRVTLIKLPTGDLVIHSTAPFSQNDIHEINGLGKPSWLVDVTFFHDTFSREGRAAFPSATYLAPEGFEQVARVQVQSLMPPPPEWCGQIEVFPILGMPRVKEHALLHVPSRTLIVADLVFNLSPQSTLWTKSFMRMASGLKMELGMSRMFKFMIKDHTAFCKSIRPLLALNFDRLIMAHGLIIERSAKEPLRKVLQQNGFGV